MSLANSFDVHNCDCENGMSQITLQYVGEQTASKILGFYKVKKSNSKETPLTDCEFLNVQNGDTITCSAGEYGVFKRRTRFEIYYDGNDDDAADCIGDTKTKCSKPIIGDSVRKCDNLVVVAHVDGDGAFCDANVLSADPATQESNAVVDNERSTSDPLRVWKELDLWIRWMLICLLIAFISLIGISCLLCGLWRKAEAKQTEKEHKLDDIMKTIAMKKWQQKRNSEEVEGSVIRHIAMALTQRRRETWGANERTVVQTHRAAPATSSQSSSESVDQLDTMMAIDAVTGISDEHEDEMQENEDLDLGYEDEYYFEDENMPTVMHYDDGTNIEYAE